MGGSTRSGRVRRLVASAGVVGLLGLGGFALAGGPLGAATFSCPNFDDTDVGSPPAGTTGYLFIGTNISGSSSSITVFYDSTSQTVAGTQQGNGAFHYVVNIPQGATVTNATVTGATAQTTVTVSGCLNGPELPTTTTTSETPTTAGTQVSPQVSPEVVTAPSPAGAVRGAARFTG